MSSCSLPRRCAAVALAALVASAAGCSGSGDDAAPATTVTEPSTSTSVPLATATTAGSGASTSVPASLAPAVEPVEVGDGDRPLRAPGIGVGVAVPEAWTVTDLRGDDLSVEQAEAASSDPQLSGLLADDGALLDRARVLAAIGAPGAAGTPLVTLLQLDTVVAAVPDDVAVQVRDQVEGYGASDVVVDRIEVPGLADGIQALQVRAVLTIAGLAQDLAVLVVPTSIGLAVVTVRAESTALASIVRSLAAS